MENESCLLNVQQNFYFLNKCTLNIIARYAKTNCRSAVQWSSLHCKDDHRLCFLNTNNTIPLLPKSQISSFYPFSVAAQAGLFQTCSKTQRTVFSRRGSSYLFQLNLLCSQGYLFFKIGPLFELLQGNRSLGFPTRSDTNRPVQPQKKLRILKFWIEVKEE